MSSEVAKDGQINFGSASGSSGVTTASNATRWRQQASLGDLSDDFLRVEGPGASPSAYANYPTMFAGYQGGGLLTITLVQARLAKNYGMTRMDPYCRVRVGSQVFETATAHNGSKTPLWNKLIQCHLPDNIREFYIEVLDECTFSLDERIGWSIIQIKEAVFEGETVDEWYSLSGKQGDGKEGMINVILQYKAIPVTPMMGAPMMVPAPMYQVPIVYGYPGTVYQPYMYPPQFVPVVQAPMQTVPVSSQARVHTAPLEINQKDLQTLKDMFPSFEDDIIRSVLQQCGGNLDAAVNHLVSMTST